MLLNGLAGVPRFCISERPAVLYVQREPSSRHPRLTTCLTPPGLTTNTSAVADPRQIKPAALLMES